jgi:hypothetical protein
VRSKRHLKDVAVLVGTSPDGKCVYSASIDLGDYWDGVHPWDSAAEIVALGLARLQGFLFGGDGQLLQQFESCFDIANGRLVSSWAVHEDGTRTELPQSV